MFKFAPETIVSTLINHFMSPLLAPFIKDKGIVILDGALATELESRGANLNHPLWSAKILAEDPSLIKKVHSDYLLAGADVITSSSYQASFEGFARHGYSHQEAEDFLRKSVKIALDARAETIRSQFPGGPAPLVAASVGPYGAFLADGSEYRGNYGLSIEELKAFHRPRIAVLADSGADLLACETIPCPEEAIALIEVIEEFPEVSAWISFSCKDQIHVCSGEPLSICVSLADQSSQVIAVGINCTDPRFVEHLIEIAHSVTGKPVVAYPNKGELYDPQSKCWIADSQPHDIVADALRWKRAGAQLIGGCCRTTPADIKNIRIALQQR